MTPILRLSTRVVRRAVLRIAASALFVLATLALAAPYAYAQQVQYVYDDLGRLIAVVDPTGDSATYTYDAAGNLLSITRSSSAVKVLGFSPHAAAVGATVTIYGTGFSTAPSQNTLMFNGTTAVVSSASATQLVTTVPVGATSGLLSVTTPVGSASSTTAFTVVASTAPAVTGLTPTIGLAGTSVSVDGVNFDPVPTNDKVFFNTTLATLTSVSATNLAMPVPTGATSGRITVKTPNGTATSSADFFIPPSPFVPSDVEVTTRMATDDVKPLSITSAGKIALVVFDGVKNGRISLNVTGVSIPWSQISIRTPNGSELIAPTWVSTSGSFFDTRTLPATGTYTILIDPEGSYTGNMTLTLYGVPADASATITPGGSASSVTVTVPGQNAGVTFTGTTGQRISLSLTNVTMSWNQVSIKKPDGSALVSPTWVNGNGAFMDTQTLPTTGTYTIAIDPENTNTGSITLTLYDVPADVSGSINPGGSAVSVTVTTPGQNGALTFTGSAGQRVSLSITSVTVGSWVSILHPNGSTLVGPNWTSTIGSNFVDAQTLPTAGTYTFRIDPEYANTGGMTVTLYDVQDVTDAVTIGGAAVPVTITTPGQNGALTFSGTQGQQVTVQITSNTIGDTTVTLRKPDGSTLTSSTSSASAFSLVSQTLPVNGTYSIVIDPWYARTGSLSVSVTSP